jgi:hypothetical protein
MCGQLYSIEIKMSLEYSIDTTEPVAVSSVSSEEGNTKTSSFVPITEVTGNKRLKVSTVSLSRARRWTFTWFVDPSVIDAWRTKWVTYFNQQNIYYCIGEEICPKTGKLHLQGYVEFKNQKRFDTLKREYPGNIHWEQAKGTREENYKYFSSLISPEGPLLWDVSFNVFI